MEHLLNCHGEWQALLAALAALPVVGVWARTLLHTNAHTDTKE